MIIDSLLEKRLLPDTFIRAGIRRKLAAKLSSESRKAKAVNLDDYSSGPIAINTIEANQQHYELPSDFFVRVLGPHLKYSSGFWVDAHATLESSEKHMLEMTLQRADIRPGQSVLELGCGWGSLSLYAAQKYPDVNFTSISNSSTQKQYIDQQRQARNIHNLQIITTDINSWQPSKTYDRVVSVEMFEHCRNYKALFERIAACLKADGKLFTHIFCHEKYAYLYEPQNPGDWIARYFFTGGCMPSFSLFESVQNSLRLVEKHRVNGTHYAHTCRAWLERFDDNEHEINNIFKLCYGSNYRKWISYWRIFFMACEELFRYDSGNQWFVGHFSFEKI